MTRYRSRHGRRTVRLTLLWVAALMAVGGYLVTRAVTEGRQLPPAAAQLVPASVGTGAPSGVSTARPLAKSVPEMISIPAIGVSAPVMQLGSTSYGAPSVPPLGNHNLAAWWDKSVTPGQRGVSVIVGHVDDFAGPSVFYYLKDLHKGDMVDVRLADGTTAKFRVDGVQEVAKASFPASVYKNGHSPDLRLITCGGPFDSATGQYLDSIIAYAHLV